jgi:hypothetical protein
MKAIQNIAPHLERGASYPILPNGIPPLLRVSDILTLNNGGIPLGRAIQITAQGWGIDNLEVYNDYVNN